jgi:aspartate oxidase
MRVLENHEDMIAITAFAPRFPFEWQIYPKTHESFEEVETAKLQALAGILELEAGNRSPRFANVLATAKLMAAMALAREESRGGHYRDDYPQERPQWRHRTFTTLSEADSIAREAISKETV